MSPATPGLHHLCPRTPSLDLHLLPTRIRPSPATPYLALIPTPPHDTNTITIASTGATTSTYFIITIVELIIAMEFTTIIQHLPPQTHPLLVPTPTPISTFATNSNINTTFEIDTNSTISATTKAPTKQTYLPVLGLSPSILKSSSSSGLSLLLPLSNPSLSTHRAQVASSSPSSPPRPALLSLPSPSVASSHLLALISSPTPLLLAFHFAGDRAPSSPLKDASDPVPMSRGVSGLGTTMASFRAATFADAFLLEQRLQKLKERLNVPYDETRPDHQEALRALWNTSFPDTELTSLVSEQWKDMGWQGPNPSTDFRGCGFVSLENLSFFARTYPASFQRLLLKQQGMRATWEYPFAVAGVNISYMLINLLELNSARPKSLPGINFIRVLSGHEEAFDVLYCIAFEMMDAQWLAMRASYMQFKEVLEATKLQLERELSLEDLHRIHDLPAYNLLYK